MTRRFARGARPKKTPITEDFTYDDFRVRYGERALPLFVIDAAGKLRVATVERPLEPKPGERLISLAEPTGEETPRIPAADEAASEESDAQG